MSKRLTAKEYQTQYGKKKSNESSTSGHKYHAQRCTYNNITFDSKAEMRFYIRAESLNLTFECQKKYEIVPACIFQGRKRRARTFSLDFFFPDFNVLVDVKGGQATQTTSFKLRVAMLMSIFAKEENSPSICVVSGNEIDAFLFELKANKPNINKFKL